MGLTPVQEQKLKTLISDLPTFCSSCLKVVAKDGSTAPFILNRAQRYLHQRLEAQKLRSGRVRAIILKGRQQGCSTLIAARYLHQALFNTNRTIYILAHQSDSTTQLFKMVNRFYLNLPPYFKLPLDKDTERGIAFTNGSSYSVGTAGSSQVGRGFTVQFLHASEAAFYENADELSVGLMQAVADIPGTEFIIESTANGPGNFFHSRCVSAMTGEDPFEFIFIPWYWQDEYTSNTPIQLTQKEQEMLDAYGKDGLTVPHLAWRRQKIKEFDDREWKFIQEYPMNAAEAFIKSDARFFSLPNIYSAVSRQVPDDPFAPTIFGVDPGRTGDETSICERQGRKVHRFTIPRRGDEMQEMILAGQLAKLLDPLIPNVMMFIDVGCGYGTIDRLHEMGYKRYVKGVHFGERAIQNDLYRNHRTEMYFAAKEWLSGEVSIPHDDVFIAECAAIPDYKDTSSNLHFIESKDKIKDELKHSPNRLDAFVLTFAFPVRRKDKNGTMPQTRKTTFPTEKWNSQLRTLKGVR